MIRIMMRVLLLFTLSLFFSDRIFAETFAQPETQSEPQVYIIPVLVVKYFPVKNEKIDITVTGDWGESLEATRLKTEQLTSSVIAVLEEGSRYHGYKNKNARPSLEYKVIEKLEFLESLPTLRKPGHSKPMPDYYNIMKKIDIKYWVETRGVKEVWIWAYHGGVIDLWESNMAGPFGDISNSDCDPNDLPVLSKTYTVYHYNYQRGVSEAVEDHMHQIERIFGNIDQDMFWGKFAGYFPGSWYAASNPGLSRQRRCGCAHFPPNGMKDYDWANKDYSLTDIEDWDPDNRGKEQKMNCEKWQCDSLKWFIYWMQNIPGKNNGLTYKGRHLTNWWRFIGEFDSAKKYNIGLYE